MDRAQFREAVHAYRRPTGHSQQELASRLGLQRQVLARKFAGDRQAYFTHAEIKRLISTLAEWDAITQRRQAVELLALLDLPPTLFSAAEWAAPPLANLAPADAPPAPLERAASRAGMAPPPLPAPLTPLIGREWLLQLASARLLQPQVRLLTLVGPGGIGKTRLSLELGRRLGDAFDQAVVFIDLSSLTDASQVPAQLAQGLGLDAGAPGGVAAALRQRLATRPLLLILDNFEHLLPAAALLSQLLAAAPGLKLLVASRAVLQVYGEAELGVPPLDLPELAQLPPAQAWAALGQVEAVQLFVARAQAALPTFQLTPANYADVARLCVLLEGVPLAIELAASWVKLLPLPALHQRLSVSTLDLLARGNRDMPARHQSLRAVLDWSYSLLDGPSRQLFRALGVFRGSFSLAAAGSICYGDSAAPTLIHELGTLVDQSLLRPVAGRSAEPRFGMLETVREYALQRLREAGEFAALEARYVQYYLRRAEQLTDHLPMLADDPQGLAPLLEEDFENFQAAQYLDGLPSVAAAERAGGGRPAAAAPPLIQVERSIVIRRPVAEVFACIATPQNWVRWNKVVEEAYALEPGPARAGMTWYLRSSMLGRRTEQTLIITACVPDELLEVVTLQGPIDLTVRFTCASHASGTHFTYRSTSTWAPFFQLTGPILTRMTARGLEESLQWLKAFLEQPA